MKKWLALLLCVAMLCGATACGCAQTQPDESQPNVGVSQSTGKQETPNAGEFGDFEVEDTTDSTTDNEVNDTTNGSVADSSDASTTQNTTQATGTTATGNDATLTTGGITGGDTTAATTTTTQAAPSENDVNAGDWFTEDTDATTVVTTTTVAAAEQTKVGKVSLPAPGYDADGKGRIIIGEVSCENQVVSIEIKNITTKWMTEETNYLEYTCYDKKGKVLTSKDPIFGKLYMGALRAGKSVVKTFSIPTGTTRVEITGYSITYWTEWA